MLNIMVTMIRLEIVKKFISEIIILLNFVTWLMMFQLGSLTFIKSVDKVIRMYIKIIITVKMIIIVGKNIILLNRSA